MFVVKTSFPLRVCQSNPLSSLLADAWLSEFRKLWPGYDSWIEPYIAPDADETTDSDCEGVRRVS